MALIVEDGSGMSTAVAYVSVSYADSYHRARGNTAWGNLAFSTKEALILKATEFLDSEYIFMGMKTVTTQALSWPRSDVFDEEVNLLPSDSLPVALQRATAELALSLASNSDNGAQPVVVEGSIQRRRERIGVIESETEGTVDTSTRFYPRVHQLIAPFIIGKRSGGSTPALRG